MDDDEKIIVSLMDSVIRFSTYHPYAATGILGALIGSAVTYRAMTYKSVREKVNEVFTPKAYELALSENDLRCLLLHPSTEIRIETAEISLIVTAEKREKLQELPDIIIE